MIKNEKKVHILVLGHKEAGKSAIVDVLINQDKQQRSFLRDVFNDMLVSEDHPTTYTSDKYVITDTRHLSLYNGDHVIQFRKYLEETPEKFNIVLVAFDVTNKTLDAMHLWQTYKFILPEFRDIIHVVLTNTDLSRAKDHDFAEDFAKERLEGLEDYVECALPSFQYPGEEERLRVANWRTISLQRLEAYISTYAEKPLRGLDPAIGVKIEHHFRKFNPGLVPFLLRHPFWTKIAVVATFCALCLYIKRKF